MNNTLMVIGEALIDFTPTKQGVALKDVCSFTKHCGGAPINIAAAAAKCIRDSTFQSINTSRR